MGKLIQMSVLPDLAAGSLSESQDVQLWTEARHGLASVVSDVTAKLGIPKSIVVETFIAVLEELKEQSLPNPAG